MIRVEWFPFLVDRVVFASTLRTGDDHIPHRSGDGDQAAETPPRTQGAETHLLLKRSAQFILKQGWAGVSLDGVEGLKELRMSWNAAA